MTVVAFPSPSPAATRQHLEVLLNRLLDAEICRQDAARTLERCMTHLQRMLEAEDTARTAYHEALLRAGLTHEDVR